MNTHKRIYPKKYPLSEYPTFSDRLRLAMELRNYSTSELAEKIYTSSAAISMYRNGKRMPNHTILCLIAKELDVSTDFLLGMTEFIYV